MFCDKSIAIDEFKQINENGIKLLLSDKAGSNYDFIETSYYGENSPGITERLMAVLSGKFETKGLIETREYHHASSKQKALFKYQISHFDQHFNSHSAIVYEPALFSVSPYRECCVYTRNVPDWDALLKRQFIVLWWQDRYCDARWDRNLHFMTPEECQEFHKDGFFSVRGPAFSDWCASRSSFALDLFWSTAINYKLNGTCGVSYWDKQFQALESLLFKNK